MKSVGEFWFRIGIGVVLLLLWVVTALAGHPAGGAVFLVLGLAQLAWTVIAAKRTIRRAERAHSSR
ncbi:hypothetical protein [Brachybacterium paraconglomeratum]|uniref:hypothetical protein n=1 Tax=Brachybacterium paraconglomeratum TaxID=173362 RepID=UPI0022E30F69|nr:hypothetical protein [Brachybacterium paraconglomeratum]